MKTRETGGFPPICAFKTGAKYRIETGEVSH